MPQGWVLYGPATQDYFPTTGGATWVANLNDADNAMRVRFMFPKDGMVDAIGLRVTTRSGSPPQYRVGLVTEPSSENWPASQPTAYGGGSIELWTPPSTGFFWVTLSTPATAQAGDVASAMIWPGPTPPDSRNYIAVRRSLPFTAGRQRLLVTRYYTTSWNTDGEFVMMAVRYSDGSVALPAVQSGNSSSYNSNSSPDEQGCVFTLPFAATCVGCRFYHSTSGAGGPSVLRLYDASNNVLAETAEIASTVSGFSDVFWDAVALSANTTYRVTRLPTTTSTVYLAGVVLENAASRAWWPDGNRWRRTYRTDFGQWTDVDTELHMFALWLSDIQTGGGGGGPVQSGYLA